VVPLQREPLGRPQVESDVAIDARHLESGTDALLTRSAALFGDLAERVGRLADHAARREGEDEGRTAGLDPEFRRRRDNTIRGEAYDTAALEVQRSQLVGRMGEDLLAAYQTHRASPASLDAALQERRRHWIANSDPALTPQVEQIYASNRLHFMREAARDADARARTDLSTALTEEIGERLRGLSQRARGYGIGDLGMGDATVGQVLGGEITELESRLGVVGPDGRPLLTPAQRTAILRQARETVARAQVLGTFERLETNEARGQFIEQMVEDYSTSRGVARHFSLDEFERLRNSLEAELRRGLAGRGAADRELTQRVRDLLAPARQGITPNIDDLAALRGQVEASGDARLLGMLDGAIRMAEMHRNASRAPVGELQAFVVAERERLRGPHGLNEQDLRGARDRLVMMEALLSTARTQLHADPVAYGARTGLIPATELDLSTPEALARSLRARMPLAEEMGRHHGVPVRYLQAVEQQALVAAMSEGGDRLIGLAGAIAAAAGDRAPDIFRQIFDRAPGLAHMGALAAYGARTDVLRDAAYGIQLRRQEGSDFRPRAAPTQAQRQEMVNEIIGTAFGGMERARDGAASLADLLYEVRARAAGHATWQPDVYRQALRDAVGGSVGPDGHRYGGVVFHNPWMLSRGSNPIVIPPQVRADRWQDLIDALRPEDFAVADADGRIVSDGLPRGGGDRAIPLSAVRRGTLVPIGGGFRFYVAMGGPNGANPLWLAAPPGTGEQGRFVLDLDALLPRLRERRPELFFGAQVPPPRPVIPPPAPRQEPTPARAEPQLPGRRGVGSDFAADPPPAAALGTSDNPHPSREAARPGEYYIDLFGVRTLRTAGARWADD